jgi:hypothetical protein
LSGGDGGDEERGQCDPVVGVGDVESPDRGRKKKLKQVMPSADASSAGRLPERVATKRTTSNSASATVVELICPLKGLSTTVAAATPSTATR